MFRKKCVWRVYVLYLYTSEGFVVIKIFATIKQVFEFLKFWLSVLLITFRVYTKIISKF